MTILTTTDEIRKAVRAELNEKENTKSYNPEELFSIPQVAQKLNKNYKTIKRMIQENRLEATTDKRYVSQRAIDNYLNATS